MTGKPAVGKRPKCLRYINAIAKHKKQTGQNLCRENDLELWQVLENGPIDIKPYNRPPCDAFLVECLAYWKSRKPDPNEKNI